MGLEQAIEAEKQRQLQQKLRREQQKTRKFAAEADREKLHADAAVVRVELGRQDVQMANIEVNIGKLKVEDLGLKLDIQKVMNQGTTEELTYQRQKLTDRKQEIDLLNQQSQAKLSALRETVVTQSDSEFNRMQADFLGG